MDSVDLDKLDKTKECISDFHDIQKEFQICDLDDSKHEHSVEENVDEVLKQKTLRFPSLKIP